MGTKICDTSLVFQKWMIIKRTLWNDVGLVRNPQRLKKAYEILVKLKREIEKVFDEAILTKEIVALRNGCLTALLITEGAMKSLQSKGCHYVEHFES